MAIQDNSPTFSYVKLDGISVTWNNEIFMVKDFATNKKYIYWNADIPNQLNASNTMPNRSTVQHLVLINDNGVSTIVPPTDENFSISFDGNSEQAIKEKIFGLYAKNEEHGEKFIAIEQDIDGIKQIVGETGGSDLSLWERVSKLEQTSDEISISVQENKKEYNDDKEVNQLRENLNSSIIQINSILGIFKSEITECFKDNEVSKEEAEEIKVQLELLENAKADFDGCIDTIILIAEKNGQSQDAISLSSAKESFNNIHQNLRSNIENSIIDSIITTTELTVIIDSFAKYNTKINEVKNTCDEIIILGIGGVITEELARIDVKSDEIKLSVSKVESDFSSNMSIQKIELEKQIEDVSSALNTFEESVNTVFKDGIIDEAEKQILSEKIANINKEKSDIDARFLAIYHDEKLSLEKKENLLSTYEDYVAKHNELTEKINYVISDDMVNDAEKLEVDTLFKKYSNALSSFSVAIAKAIEDVAFNTAKEELDQAKNELKGEINDVKDSIEGIEGVLDGTFEDNILDEVERKNIEQDLENLSREKIDIDNIYANLYGNEFLPDEDKLNLKKSYDDFVSSYNEVISVSNAILNKETLIDDIDKANLSKAISSYKDKLNLFFTQANLSNEIISNNKSDNLKNEVQQDLNDINNKIDDVLESINGSILDGVIDEVEIKIIEENLNSLNKEKMDVDARYLVIYENEYLDGQLKEDLFNAKTDFDVKIENVITTILDMISDSSVSEEEKERFNLVREEFNLSSAELNKKFEQAIEYISKKMIDNAQSELKKEINDLNGAISGLEETMNGAFLDGVLSESEKMSIKQHLLTLSSEKCDIDKQYATINSNELLDGEVKTNLVNSYNNYIDSYDNLISTINTILEKNTIVDSTDRDNLNNAFASHNRNLGIYTENAITALDYIAKKKAEVESEKVDKKYAEIILDPETGILSKVEHINSKIDGEGGLEQRIQSAEEKITPDGIVQTVKDSQLIKDIQTGITTNSQNISRIDQKADSISFDINSKIDGEGGLEQRLQSAEEKITPDGISQTVKDSQLIKDIQTGITTNSQNISRIDQKADSISFEVSKKVGNDSIISAINQTAEAIRISASKVNLNGYVTFSELGDYVTEDDLGKYGTTTIHGDRIETGSIKVNQLSSNNENPIIKLFPNTDGYCSIDATQQYESGGKGHYVRLKWDKYNYWYVGNNSAGVYLGRTDNNAEGQEYDTHFWISTTHARVKPNKLMIGNGDCRIDTNGGAIRLYTTPDGGLDRGLRIYNSSGRLEIRQSDLTFTNVDNGVYKTVAWSDHTHSDYASTSHTHEKVSYNSTKVECYNGYIVFDAGSAYFRMDNGSNHGGAYKFYPNAGGVDLGCDYSKNNRWRTVYSQNSLNTSDVKCKEDIQYLDDNIARFGKNNTPFLDFIKNDFRPATYMYKAMREEEGHVDADRQIGFIANDIIDTEVGQTFLYNFGTEEETDIMYSPTGYTTVVARALQEEINKREELEEEVSSLKNEIESLKEIVLMLQEKITV